MNADAQLAIADELIAGVRMHVGLQYLITGGANADECNAARGLLSKRFKLSNLLRQYDDEIANITGQNKPDQPAAIIHRITAPRLQSWRLGAGRRSESRVKSLVLLLQLIADDPACQTHAEVSKLTLHDAIATLIELQMSDLMLKDILREHADTTTETNTEKGNA